MRKIAFALALTLAAARCAHTTMPATAPPLPSGVTVASTACNPASALVNAALWVQSSAEYRAAALQTYAAAHRALDAALADPSWVGATEDSATATPQPPAIVLDLDETAIDNTAFEARVVHKGITYDNATWKQWYGEENAQATPGAKDFLNYAHDKGVTVFYVTNRSEEEEKDVRLNLEKLGYPLDDKLDTLLMNGERKEWTSDKSSRRAFVAHDYRLLLLLGDDLNDFANARDKSMEDRNAIVESHRDWWGSHWLIVPNPIYGSWERAVVGTKGTPCELYQKKLDALKEK